MSDVVNLVAGKVGSANHSLPVMCHGPDASLAGGSSSGGSIKTLSTLPPLPINFDIQV